MLGSSSSSSKGGGNNNCDYSFKILLIGDSGVGKSSLLVTFISNFVHDLSPTIGVDFKIKMVTIGGKRLKLTIWDTVKEQAYHPLKYAVINAIFTPMSRRSVPYASAVIASGLLHPHNIYSSTKIYFLPDNKYISYCGIVVAVKVNIGQKVSGKHARDKIDQKNFAGQERFGTLTSSYYRGAHGIILVYDVTRRETFTNLSEVWAKEVELYSTNQECIKVLVGNKVDRDSERAVTQEEGMALAQQLKCSFLECSARTRANVHQCFKDLVLKILEVPTLLEKGSTAVKKQILRQKQVQKPPESNTCCFQ
ncbi:hypothetical protein Goshw_017390 [Gossypium schwendimanii]|uniref:Uncharacterized protein n=1 Tax=Gossypium schwendimanii TaxID=34291 RepID=A0A7J9MI74_GOSSC|nr:hypothetical protein [Gossypium schwendimanii]